MQSWVATRYAWWRGAALGCATCLAANDAQWRSTNNVNQQHLLRFVVGSAGWTGLFDAEAAAVSNWNASGCALYAGHYPATRLAPNFSRTRRRVSRVVAMTAAAEQVTLTHIVDACAADAESLAQNNILMARVRLRLQWA
jgi:hypothetical protein